MSSWHRNLLVSYMRESSRSQREIGTMLGVTGVTVGRWIAGKAEIRTRYQERIEALADTRPAPDELRACPLKGSFCPVFDGHRMNFAAAELIRLLAEMSPDAHRELLRLAVRIQKKSQKDS